MIYQPLDCNERDAESARRSLREVNEWYYWNYVRLRTATYNSEANIIAIVNTLDAARHEMKLAESRCEELQAACEHHYVLNESGDKRCARCGKFSLLATLEGGRPK